MKTLIRLLVILLAAVAVTGATWAVGQNSGSTGASVFVQGARPTMGENEGRTGGEGRERGDHHAAQWTSLQGWLGFAETLVPIGLVITLVTVPTSLWKRYRRARRSTSATAA